MKYLFLLDLDHTLIYGSYAPTEPATFLFQYHKYLKVYKRDLAEELVRLCQSQGDVIVYTTALRRYAKRICSLLKIDYIELLSRKNCITVNGKLRKQIKSEWVRNYDRIVIIDDSPNVWITNSETIEILVPDEFRGQANDFGLEPIISIIHKYKNHEKNLY